MKIFIPLVVLFFASTATATDIGSELIDLAKTDFPHWGKCEATITATTATLVCENKTITVAVAK